MTLSQNALPTGNINSYSNTKNHRILKSESTLFLHRLVSEFKSKNCNTNMIEYATPDVTEYRLYYIEQKCSYQSVWFTD